MLKWWRDIRRFDRALNYSVGLFCGLILALAGTSLAIRADEAANRILGAFLVIVGCGTGVYVWKKVRALIAEGQQPRISVCPGCQ